MIVLPSQQGGMNRRGNFSPSRQYKIGRGEGEGEQIFARTSSLVHQTHFPFPEQKKFFLKKRHYSSFCYVWAFPRLANSNSLSFRVPVCTRV